MGKSVMIALPSKWRIASLASHLESREQSKSETLELFESQIGRCRPDIIKNSLLHVLFTAVRCRARKAVGANCAASYVDVGRRLLNQVTVSSPAGSRAFTYQGFDPVGCERSRLEVKNGSTTGATTNGAYDALGRLSTALTTSSSTTS